jgi:hypothetical protein
MLEALKSPTAVIASMLLGLAAGAGQMGMAILYLKPAEAVANPSLWISALVVSALVAGNSLLKCRTYRKKGWLTC